MNQESLEWAQAACRCADRWVTAEVYDELEHIRKQYKHMTAVVCKPESRAFLVGFLTAPITLEDTYLGPLRVSMSVSVREDGKVTSSVCVTGDEGRGNSPHPHVSNGGEPCLGDATDAYEAAIEEGALGDAADVVVAVLNAYDPDSCYWQLGPECGNCGCHPGEDSVYTCVVCRDDVCSECEDMCSQCDSSAHAGCLHRCTDCSRMLCCAETCEWCEEKYDNCERCGGRCRVDELDDDGMCEECWEEEEEEEEEEEQEREGGAPCADGSEAVDESLPRCTRCTRPFPESKLSHAMCGACYFKENP